MGCDIHTLAERSYEYDGETHWVAITEPVFPYDWYDEERPIQGYNHPYDKRPIHSRNYRLFALLADVRNQDGSIEPIKQPVGVPDNATKKWRKYVKKYGGDLHSHTVYTVQELLDAVAAGKFSQTIHQIGDVREDQYLAFRDHGVIPTFWSVPFAFATSEVVTAEQYEQGQRPTSPYSNGGRVRIEWDWEPEDSAFGFFLTQTLPALQLQGDPDKVRVQIAFDN